MIVRAVGTRILLVGFGVLVAMGLVELGFRVANVAPEPELRRFGAPFLETNPFVGWSFLRNSEFTYAAFGEYSTRVKINSKGLRDHEYEYRKGNAVFRVLILGDSFSAALGGTA